MQQRGNQKRFTLVELLIVITVLIILTVVSFVIIDPSARLAEARNEQRWLDVSTMMTGVQQTFLDADGEISDSMSAIDQDTDSVQIITASATDCSAATCAGQKVATTCASLGAIEGEYIDALPIDPSAGTEMNSQYYIDYNSGIFKIGSCVPEVGKDGTKPTISVTR